MSQVSSYVGGAVPGAGIQTLTGNNGAINVGPDGAGDVIIQGAGDITVTGDALTHTLTITTTGAAGTYITDAGNAVPAAGLLNVIGTPDEVNTIGFGNTIRIGLPANVQITNNLDVGSTLTVWNELMVVNDISSTLGSIYALFGDIVSGNSLVGQDLVVFNGIDVTGPSVFQSLNRGVVQVNAVHTLFTSEGANGQLLIGSSTGPALWAHLTAGAGIAITNAANSITIEATGALASTYRTDGGDALPNLGIIRIVGGANIGTTGAGNTVTVSLDPNIVLTSVVATNITANADLNGHDVHVGHDLQVTHAITTSSLTATGAIQGAALNSTQDITAVRDINVGQDVNVVRNVVAQAITATDHLETLNNLYVATHNGVLQSDGAGLVSATNGNPTGTNGQLLISGPAAPAWHALESDDGSVNITYPGDSRINLRAAGATPSVLFHMSMNNTVSWAANNVEVFYDMGKKLALTIRIDTAAACYAGDGIDQAAYFNPPYNGYYLIKAQITVRNTSYWVCKNAVIFIEDYTIGRFVLDNRQYLASAFNGAGTTTDPYTATLSITGILHLIPGHHYGVRTYLHTRSDAISQHYTLGSVPIGIYTDSISNFQGFLVYRL